MTVRIRCRGRSDGNWCRSRFCQLGYSGRGRRGHWCLGRGFNPNPSGWTRRLGPVGGRKRGELDPGSDLGTGRGTCRECEIAVRNGGSGFLNPTRAAAGSHQDDWNHACRSHLAHGKLRSAYEERTKDLRSGRRSNRTSPHGSSSRVYRCNPLSAADSSARATGGDPPAPMLRSRPAASFRISSVLQKTKRT